MSAEQLLLETHAPDVMVALHDDEGLAGPSDSEEESVRPTRGFGDFFYKQKRAGEVLRPAKEQVRANKALGSDLKVDVVWNSCLP